MCLISVIGPFNSIERCLNLLLPDVTGYVCTFNNLERVNVPLMSVKELRLIPTLFLNGQHESFDFDIQTF